LGLEDRRNSKIRHPDARNNNRAMADGDGNLEVPRGLLLRIYQIGIPAT
jgi:hypothetical protein